MKLDKLVRLTNKYFKYAAKEKDTDSGAGILFTCEEDGTLLLILRSKKVNDPNVWGLPGGGVRREGEDNQNETNLEGAKREATEELGCLPKSMKYITHVADKKKDFTYTTYVYNLSLKDKKDWSKKIELDWENSDWKWFKVDELPTKLHYGMESLHDLLADKGFEIFSLPE